MLPPSPKNPPANLTEATPAYKFRVVSMLFSLLLFLGIYFGMIATTVWVIRDAFSKQNDNLILGVAAVIFLIFLVKPLFKRQRVNRDELIEITREEEPAIFEFLDALIAEVGAPRPNKVYITHTVNAAVFYDSSALSLIWPTKKNLLIGLGLVNGLNVSELKAVLAHEFGHFSQRSMKLGTYVYVANRIIADMVWGRDSWDDALRRMSGWDIRISIFIWAIIAFVWVIRQVLGLLFRVINLLEAAMSRQMEFNADRVAVSVTGSDAIVNGLYRAGFSDACLDYSLGELSDAIDHELYTNDLFYHQSQAEEHLRTLAKKPEWGTPPSVPKDNPGAARIFDADDDSRPSMWASHPANTAREENAKEIYVPCEVDARPAWALFTNPESLRKRVTAHFIKLAIDRDYEPSPASEVQAFIDQERAETTYDAKYHGFYGDGSINLDELDVIAEAIESDAESSEELADRYSSLFDNVLESKMEELREVAKELRQVHTFLSSGDRKTSFRGRKISQGEAEIVISDMADSARKLSDALIPKHEDIVRTHLRMAKILGEKSFEALLFRYRFQQALQVLTTVLEDEEATLQDVMNIIGQEEIEPTEWAMAKIGLEKMIDSLSEVRTKSEEWAIPSMASFEDGRKLSEFVFEGCNSTEIEELSQLLVLDEVDGDFLNELIGYYQQASGRFARMRAKSVGGILALQEKTASQWREKVGPS